MKLVNLVRANNEIKLFRNLPIRCQFFELFVKFHDLKSGLLNLKDKVNVNLYFNNIMVRCCLHFRSN